MDKFTEKVVSLINKLPEKDKVIANKFLAKRDIESFKELIDSEVYKLRRRREETFRNNPEVASLDTWRLLQSEVDLYLLRFGRSEKMSSDNSDYSRSNGFHFFFT